MKLHPIEYAPPDIVIREDLRLLHLSDAFAIGLGYDNSKELSTSADPLAALMSAESIANLRFALQGLRAGTGEEFICFCRRKDGDYALFVSLLSHARWQQQSAYRLVIHPWAGAQGQGLPESEQRFRRVFEQQQQFVTLVSPAGEILEANTQALQIQGLKREDYLGKLLWQTPAWALLPEWQKLIEAQVRDAVRTNTTVHSDDVYQSLDGGIRYARASYTPICGDNNEVDAVLVQAHDVTDQKVSELIRRDNQQRLELAMTAASMGTWEWNLADDQVFWSAETFNIFRVEKSQFKNSFASYLDFVVPESRDIVAEHASSIIRRSKDIDVFKYDHEIMRGDDTRGWVEVRGKIFLGENNRAVRISGILMDITETKRRERELSILYRAMESSSSSVVVINLQRCIEYVNEKFTEITGYAKEEALGQRFDMVSSGDNSAAVYDELWKQVEAGADWRGEFKNKRKSGEIYWERASISAVHNQSGDITHFVAIQEDVTNEIKMSEQINYQASHDALTGLINRYEFERNIKSLPDIDGIDHALCFLDLDQFKIINDTCGHVAGDELLRQLSPLLKNVVSGRGLLARLGGDEFAVFLENCSMDLALTTARAMLEAVEDFQFAWEGYVFRLGVSIGLVPVSSPIPKFSELLKQADTACYMAKDSGRNRIHIYYPDDVDITTRRGEMQWAARIYDALDQEKFCLFAQLILPLQVNDLPVYEFLVRMRDKDGSLIPPGAFISAAERYNVVTKIDRWVVKKALSLLANSSQFLNEIDFVSINVSGQSVADPSTLDYVISQLVQQGVDGSKICFEITETAAILNLGRAEEFISELKKLGCRFALDDFGSGVSSFGYLKKLPVDYLKIDGMFVKDIVDDPIDYAMVKSINEIGQTMGMMTIAEFVETKAIERKIREIGVDYVQGIGIGVPLPVETLLKRK